eukprot:4175019-Pleurochrysis_carterae.AAC.1
MSAAETEKAEWLPVAWAAETASATEGGYEGIGIEARRYWVAVSVAKQQTGKSSVPSAQSGRAASFGIERSHGFRRKGREWTNTLSLGNARALSSLSGKGVAAKAAGGNKGCAWLAFDPAVQAGRGRRWSPAKGRSA